MLSEFKKRFKEIGYPEDLLNKEGKRAHCAKGLYSKL